MSIGVIGGADGPTSIFVASNISRVLMIPIGIALVAAVAFGLYLIFRKRNK